MKNSAQNLLDFCFNCVSILPIMPIFILMIKATEASREFSIYWEISAVISAALISYTGSSEINEVDQKSYIAWYFNGKKTLLLRLRPMK